MLTPGHDLWAIPGTSITDMFVAKGQPIEYLIDAVRTRLQGEKVDQKSDS
jgi:hypothetical protein